MGAGFGVKKGKTYPLTHRMYVVVVNEDDRTAIHLCFILWENMIFSDVKPTDSEQLVMIRKQSDDKEAKTAPYSCQKN